MKSIASVLCKCAFALVLLASCEEDNITRYPAFGGFRLQPNEWWHPGDSVTVTAVQLTQGDLIYKAKYKWEITVSLSDGTTKSYTKNYEVIYDKEKQNPQFGFRLEEGQTGPVTIRFKADYYNSASGAPEVPKSMKADGCHGEIQITGASGLYGKASGTCAWNIVPVDSE